MIGIIVLFGGVIVLASIIGSGAYFMWDTSFRNKVSIARQTGHDVQDVIWINTKFKVINNDGTWKIVFRHLTESTGSIEGRFWTKFLKPTRKARTLLMNDEEWKRRDMSKLLQRGLFLYETSEGVFFPMSIQNDGEEVSFKIIDQDNRLFLTNEVANINMLTGDTKKQLIGMIALIIGVVVLGVVIFGGMYWIHAQSTANVKETTTLCAAYTKEILNITLSGIPQYASSIPLPGG